MKIHPLARLLFAVAALFLGSILRNAFHADVFLWLGIAGCVLIFALLGRREEFEERKNRKK